MDTKEQLLRAATAVVSTRGSASLTLEAVALEAGVSKGGLLYHFPTKKALIAGMVSQAVEAFEGALATAEASVGDWLEGYVEATLVDLDTGDPLSGILTAAAEDPELVAPFRTALARWYRRAQDDYGLQATPLLLALDALWLHVRLGTLPELDRRGVADELRKLARNCGPRRPR